MNVYECTLVIADGIAETQAVGAAIELQVERIIGTQAATSGGVSDGDKGDIVVSASGNTWTIDTDAVTSGKIASSAVTSAKIADSNVTSAKLADDAATEAKIADSAVTADKIGTGAVNESKIAAGAVTETRLGARSVTAEKLFAVSHEKLIGRHSAGPGDAQEIGIDGGLEFQGSNIRRAALTGDVTASAGGNSTTIASGAVTTAKMGGDVTAAGKALLDDADAAAQRTTLGLGTAATSASSAFEASGAVATHAAVTSAVHGISAFAATFLDDADAAAVRTTLGITSGIGGTLGSTDNALARADGTGGVTAQGSVVIIDDSGNATGLGSVTCTAFAILQSTYSGRTLNRVVSDGTNESVVIGPSGTGYLSLLTPDGTTAGGNQRGNRAVDFNVALANAANVASGADSFACGADARASGAGSFAFGNSGASTIASGAGAIAIGVSASSSGIASVAIGGYPTASGNYGATALGYSTTASGTSSTALGDRSSAYLTGQVAQASGRFASNGDAQMAGMVARRATADATASNLFLDGSSARIVVPANSSGVAMISVVARTNTATDQHMTWRRRVNWKRGVAVGTVSVDVETVGTDRGYTGGAWGAGPAWTLAITADTTNGAIDIIGTGTVTTNIRWAASIEWVETTFA